MLHLYAGSMDGSAPCSICGESGYSDAHFKNGLQRPCDYDNGPCACGAWHSPKDFEGEWSRIAKMDDATFVDWLKANWEGDWTLPKTHMNLRERYLVVAALERVGHRKSQDAGAR